MNMYVSIGGGYQDINYAKCLQMQNWNSFNPKFDQSLERPILTNVFSGENREMKNI